MAEILNFFKTEYLTSDIQRCPGEERDHLVLFKNQFPFESKEARLKLGWGDRILWSQIGSGFQNHASLCHPKFPGVQPLPARPGPARENRHRGQMLTVKHFTGFSPFC